MQFGKLLKRRRAGAATDPNFANVVLLMHFDGTNGSTTLTDVKGKTVTAGGNAQISTAQSVYGGASVLFDGSNDYASVAASADFSIGTTATIEFRIRPTVISGTQYLLKQSSGIPGGWECYINSAGAVSFNANATSGIVTSASGVLSANTWAAVAVVGNAGTWQIYINGVASGSSASGTPSYVGGDPLLIGAFSTTQFGVNGYMDELRITKGVARYTGTYTPAGAAFPDS